MIRPGMDGAALFDARNLPWLLLSIGVVKVLHELGHAFACKHFGGEVRELGFMLLVFAPCLYCDVSDAWRLPNKWQRIAVSAAGICVEIVLAAIATIAIGKQKARLALNGNGTKRDTIDNGGQFSSAVASGTAEKSRPATPEVR